jgi:hypothetical protein
MRHLLASLVLIAFVSVQAGCGSNNTATTPDKIPPMPKGDAPGKKPDAGGSASEG